MLRKLVAATMVAALITGASGSYAHGAETVYDLAVPAGGTTDLDGTLPSTLLPTPAALTADADGLSVGASATVADQTVASIATTGGGNVGIGVNADGSAFSGDSVPFDLTVTAGINSTGGLTIRGEVRELQAASIQAAGDIRVGDGEANEDDAVEYDIESTGAFGINSNTDGVSALVTGAKTTVTAGSLVMGNPDTNGSQSVTVDNKATLIITGGATPTPTDLGNTNAAGGTNTFNLQGANASFTGGLTVGDRGQVAVGRSSAVDTDGGTTVSNLAVGARNEAGTVGGLRVQSDEGLPVNTGATLNVLEALADPDATTPDEVAYGDIILTNDGTIVMGANATVNAGVLEVRNNTVIGDTALSGTSTGSVLNLEGLTVTAGSTFAGREGVAINGGVGNIQGTHEMVETESYDSLVIGKAGIFQFNGTAAKELTLGAAAGATGAFTLTKGGTLSNIGDEDLTIKGAGKIDVVESDATGVAVISTTGDGSIIATNTVLNVAADLGIGTVAGTEIAVKQLTITSRYVVANGTGTFSSAEQVVIGGGEQQAGYMADGASTVWKKGRPHR
ncbi:MAG: hypothetical protein LIQ31_12110 [Planctomycetes bacterium]|nr:hypothetical protein [Planctomycetota bacterium]